MNRSRQMITKLWHPKNWIWISFWRQQDDWSWQQIYSHTRPLGQSIKQSLNQKRDVLMVLLLRNSGTLKVDVGNKKKQELKKWKEYQVTSLQRQRERVGLGSGESTTAVHKRDESCVVWLRCVLRMNEYSWVDCEED